MEQLTWFAKGKHTLSPFLEQSQMLRIIVEMTKKRKMQMT